MPLDETDKGNPKYPTSGQTQSKARMLDDELVGLANELGGEDFGSPPAFTDHEPADESRLDDRIPDHEPADESRLDDRIPDHEPADESRLDDRIPDHEPADESRLDDRIPDHEPADESRLDDRIPDHEPAAWFESSLNDAEDNDLMEHGGETNGSYHEEIDTDDTSGNEVGDIDFEETGDSEEDDFDFDPLSDELADLSSAEGDDDEGGEGLTHHDEATIGEATKIGADETSGYVDTEDEPRFFSEEMDENFNPPATPRSIPAIAVVGAGVALFVLMGLIIWSALFSSPTPTEPQKAIAPTTPPVNVAATVPSNTPEQAKLDDQQFAGFSSEAPSSKPTTKDDPVTPTNTPSDKGLNVMPEVVPTTKNDLVVKVEEAVAPKQPTVVNEQPVTTSKVVEVDKKELEKIENTVARVEKSLATLIKQQKRSRLAEKRANKRTSEPRAQKSSRATKKPTYKLLAATRGKAKLTDGKTLITVTEKQTLPFYGKITEIQDVGCVFTENGVIQTPSATCVPN